MVTNPAPDQKTSPPGARRPVAMTAYAIAVALFAAFVVGGILGKVIPLWLVAVLGLVIGAAVFVFVDRYPACPGAGRAVGFKEHVMIVILGLIILVAALVVGVAGVLRTLAARMRSLTGSRCSATT